MDMYGRNIGGEKEIQMANDSVIPPDFFETLYDVNAHDTQPPRVPDGSRISKALAAELKVSPDKPSIASD